MKQHTHTRTRSNTHLQRFALKIAKVGARKANSTGHSHFCHQSTRVYTRQPSLVSVTCWIVRGWNSFDSADTYADKSLGSDIMSVCPQIWMCVFFGECVCACVCAYEQHVEELLVLSAEHSVTAVVREYLTMWDWWIWKELLSLIKLHGCPTVFTHRALTQKWTAVFLSAYCECCCE